ncbi:MAG: hypothetical protein M1819_004334 [Sarea resinae]|nr:MAG: hypothetical protein M1819_004334 [Sarea resinae]
MASDDPASAEDEREIELSSIAAIFPELVVDPTNAFAAEIDLPVTPSRPVAIYFPPLTDRVTLAALPTPPISDTTSDGEGAARPAAAADRRTAINALKGDAAEARDVHHLAHLPSLKLRIELPEGYPHENPPTFGLSTAPEWIPRPTMERLVNEGRELWEDLGREQVVFAYLDHLQQAAERGFDLVDGKSGALEVAQDMKISMLDFDIKTKREKFEQETFECGVCLEPKKGSACHRLLLCSHVFCVACLQDFYNTCITEGDVSQVKCLAPDCGKSGPDQPAPEQLEAAQGRKRKRKIDRTLNPSELLQIPLEQDMVKRYVDLKRKKELESDKRTVYCPRTWCQGAARSKKHPKPTSITDPAATTSENSDSDSSDDEDEALGEDANGRSHPPAEDRLAICEDCAYAFCRVCLQGWHGELLRCWPPTATTLSAEDKATYEYMRLHTTPCPTCSSPAQKTHGCNHMRCFQCGTHFCYLCSAWLDESNPYKHFNQKGQGCFQRLWELEMGENPELAPLNRRGIAGDRGWDHMNGPPPPPAVGGGGGGAAAVQIWEPGDDDDADDEGANNPVRLPPAPDPPRQAAVAPPWVLNRDGADQHHHQQHQHQHPPAEARNPPPRRVPAPAPAAPVRVDIPPRAAVPPDGRVRRPHLANAQRAAGMRERLREDPRNEGLAHFLAMVENDEEDEWDSDELSEDEDGWEIPMR